MTEFRTKASHIGLCVTDMDRSLRFYCDGLGFTKVVGFDLDDTMMPGLDRSLEVASPVSVSSQFIQLDGLKVELLHFRTPAVSGQPSATRGQIGYTHLSFYVDDVDDVAAHLVTLGGTIIESTRANLGIDLVFLADPDGARVELLSPMPT